MDLVLTLVAGGAAPDLDDSIVARAGAALRAAGATVGVADWLAPRVACDLPCGGAPASTLRSAARSALAGAPVDLAVQMAAARRRHFVVADMESTIIENEMLDELAEAIGIGPRIAAVTARAMAGELDFEGALAERVALLAGTPTSLLDTVAARIRPNAGATVLAATLAAHGVHAALVTGGFTYFAEPLARRLGFAEVRANRLEIAGGKLTGRVVPPVLGRAAKRAALEDIAGRLGVGVAAGVAIGDGANDLDMVEAAGLGVAWRGKAVLAERAAARIDHADLTALLYFMGYREAEFVRP
ncbi:MAG: phosphoserine phosphatase SerB [Alphaproteobacteria bacterium]